MTLSAEELLAGSELTFEVEIPPDILRPADGGMSGTVTLRPLTVSDLQLITRAARENDSLTATLMVQRAMVQPETSVAQVATMHVGLVQFLLQRVNDISGIAITSDGLTRAAAAPLVKAAFLLSERFGWTPQQVNELTLGQVLLHLEMLREQAEQ